MRIIAGFLLLAIGLIVLATSTRPKQPTCERQLEHAASTMHTIADHLEHTHNERETVALLRFNADAIEKATARRQ